MNRPDQLDNNLTKQTRQKQKVLSALGLARRGLRFDLLTLVVGISSLVLIILVTFLYIMQHRQLVKIAEQNLAVVSNTVEANLQHAMISRDTVMFENLVREMSEVPEITSLQVLNDNGTVKFSTDENIVGKQISISDPVCQHCHQSNIIDTNKSFLFTNESNKRVLVNVNLIENKPACYECHDPSNTLLGLFITQMSLTGLNEQLIGSFWQTVLLVIVAMLVLVFLIVPRLERWIIRPVTNLTKGVTAISEGNLDYQVESRTNNEIGRLANSFDRMREQIKKSNKLRDQRENELSILFQIGHTASQLHDLSEIFNYSLDILMEKLAMADSLIFLWDETKQRFELSASKGVTQEQLETLEERRRSGYDFIQQVGESREELFISNLAEDKRVEWIWEDLENRSYLALPLLSRGKVVGVLETISQSGYILTEREVEFFKTIGQQIGAAINNELLINESKKSELEARTLYRFGMRISQSLALKEVLDEIAKSAKLIMDTDIGAVCLYDERTEELEVRSVAGKGSQGILRKRIKISEEENNYQLLEGKPVFSRLKNPRTLNWINNNLSNDAEMREYLAVPMSRGENFVGCIVILSKILRNFGEKESQLLERLGYVGVIAIENAMLYNQMKYMAALEEQGRLARELHDHLAQAVGYLNIKASIIEKNIENGKVEEAKTNLKELKKVAKSVFVDVREGVFNLRTSASPLVGLFPTLQEYLAEYRETYQLDVELVVEEDELMEFTPEVANQLLRVIQEALTNVRKHSQASKVWVKCKSMQDQALFTIEDNGIGFVPKSVDKKNGQHYGLKIMQERIGSVGGVLEFESAPGKGTRILIRLPFEDES